MRLRHKIFFGLLLIAVILFLANYVTGRIIAGVLDDVIREQVAAQAPEAELSFERIGVNPAIARVTLSDVEFSNPESYRFRTNEVRLHLSIRDVLKATRAEQPLHEIKSFRINFNSGEWDDLSYNRSIAFRSAEWQFQGGMGELFGIDGRLVAADQKQRILFTFRQPELENYLQVTPLNDLLRPVPSEFGLRRISGVLQYEPEEGITYLQPLSVESGALDLTINGQFEYRQQPASLLQPDEVTLTFNSESEPGNTTVLLGERFGRVGARSADISGDAHFVERRGWDVEHFNADYALASPELLPSEPLQREYGEMFRRLNINTSRLPARRWTGEMAGGDDGVELTNNEIEASFFDLGLNMRVLEPGTDRSRIEDGQLRVYNHAREFREFLDDVELLTGFNLQRADDEFMIRFSGPPGGLNFQFGTSE